MQNMRGRQLYRSHSFAVPALITTPLQPFPPHPTTAQPRPDLDQHITNHLLLPPQPFPSAKMQYSRQFEELCARQGMYPLMLHTSSSRLAFTCRDFILVASYYLTATSEGGNELAIISAVRVKISEVPSAVDIGERSMVVGYRSGKLAQYCFSSSKWEGTSDQLQFPVTQVQIVREQDNKQASVLALDSAGNLIHVTWTHKTVFDKIIKTLSNEKWVSLQFRSKKREKIKKMFKNLLSKEDEAEAQAMPYFRNRFHLLRLLAGGWLCAICRGGRLELLGLGLGWEQQWLVEIEKGLGEPAAMLQLGYGGFRGSNQTHLVLTVGFSQKANFYRCVQAQDQYQVIKVAEMEQGIRLGRFTGNNLILQVRSEEEGCHLLSISGLTSTLIGPHDRTKFGYMNYFVEEEGVQMDVALCQWSWLGVIDSGAFLLLEGKRLAVGRVWGWQRVIEACLEKGWLHAMHCFLMIYSGQFSHCGSVAESITERNSQMGESSVMLVRGYVESIMDRQDADEGRCMLNNIIFFMLKVEQSRPLFDDIYPLLLGRGLKEQFIETLATYIQKTNMNSITVPYVSSEVLDILVRRYRDEQREWVLQNLLKDFDLTMTQPLTLLTLCLRQQLYESLISICVRQKDYITPIVKLSGIRLSQPQQHFRIASITFWYLQQCLEGRMTPFGDEDQYIKMLASLLNFIFIPSSLQMLLQTDHQLLMPILGLFFNARILRCLVQNPDQFYMRKGQQDAIFQEGCSSEYSLIEKMLSTLIRVVERRQGGGGDWQVSLNKLLACVMLNNQFPFLVRVRINTIIFYINHPLLFAQGGSRTEEEQHEIMNGHLIRLLESAVRSIHEKCLYLQEKIDKQINKDGVRELSQLLGKQKSAQLTKILETIMVSESCNELAQTRCFIHHQLGQYAQVLQLYLRMAVPSQRRKVFDYLDANLHQERALTLEFLKWLGSLINIEQRKTVELLWGLNPHWVAPEEVIDKLTQSPDLQLGYIQRVLRQEAIEGTHKLLLRHLDIVLRQHPEDIEQYVQKMEYPLEEAYRMCEQRSSRMGKACILIKSGRNMEGVTIITQMFLEAIQEYLRGLFRKQEVHPEKQEKIMKQFRVVLKTCAKEYSVDNDRGEEIWQKTTELIFKKLNVNNIDSPNIPNSIRAILNQIVTELLTAMLQQVSTDFFLNRFVRSFGGLPMRIFLQAYHLIQHRLEFTFTVELLNKQIVEAQDLTLWVRLLQRTYRGHVCALVCAECNHQLCKNQRMVSYPCGHVYHEECYYELNNKKNKNQLCPLCYNSVDSFLVFSPDSGKKLPRYRIEADHNQLLRHKINKMREYDRNEMLQAFEGWGSTQEWVEM